MTGWSVFVALAAWLLAGAYLSGCSTPTRAKVVSLEKPAKGVQTRTRSSSHRVRKGETLYTIAWRYGLDFQDLAGWNGITPPYTIYPGQSLRLSYPVKRVSRTRPSKKPTAPASRTATSKKPTAPASRTAASAKTPRVATTPRRSAGSKASPSRQAGVDKAFRGRTKLVWQWPTRGKLEQRFSNVDPSRKGIKISGSSGQKVVAAESGKVVYAGSGLIGYGRLIIIKHNKNYLSAYGHNRKLLVKEGALVNKGEQLAEMGKNGSGRPTLHFEIRRNGTPVNPMKLLPRQR